jgi:phosphotransferase system enzyme I (PtsP)
VVSVYVREVGPSGDVLVMRGNVGFPSSAIGVTLRMGEGITGLAAECMRPVSVASASAESSYKHVPGIGEERFPSFLGVPLLGAGRVVGVLVMQRRYRAGDRHGGTDAFTAAEIALATALGAPIVLAIESARRRSAEHQRGRSAKLAGVPVVAGTAMGRVAVVPTLVGLPDPGPDMPFEPEVAIERLAIDLDRASKKLRNAADAEVRRALDNLGLALMDQRFRDKLDAGTGTGLIGALRGVAKEYARVPYRVPVKDGAIEPALAERAREIEDLCVLLYAAAMPKNTALVPPGAVWVGEHVGAFLALCAVARGAAALVCDGVIDEGPGVAIARAAGIPVLSQVDGLYAWVRPGDLVVVDADAGILRVNPAASSVESVRSNR